MTHFFVRVLCMKLCVELKGCNLKDVFNVIIDMNNMTAGLLSHPGNANIMVFAVNLPSESETRLYG